jgi:hypothetical protein
MKGLKSAGFGLLLMVAIAFGNGTRITAPKNGYSPADDVKVGKEAAAQISRELPLLPENGEVDSYVESVGQALARAIPPEFSHSEFRYEFSVVNAKDINAFALPGGPMFVNRGMIEAAHSEGEMAESWLMKSAMWPCAMVRPRRRNLRVRASSSAR